MNRANSTTFLIFVVVVVIITVIDQIILNYFSFERVIWLNVILELLDGREKKNCSPLRALFSPSPKLQKVAIYENRFFYFYWFPLKLFSSFSLYIERGQIVYQLDFVNRLASVFAGTSFDVDLTSPGRCCRWLQRKHRCIVGHPQLSSLWSKQKRLICQSQTPSLSSQLPNTTRKSTDNK